MSKSKNVRSFFNHIINEVRYGRGLNVGDDDAPKRDRGPYHQGAGMYTGAFAEKNPLLKNVAVAHLGEVHPDKDVDRGLDFINSFRGPYSNTHLSRYVKTPENPNAISNGYGRFLTDEQQEKIRGFHEKLLSKYSPSDTETARYHPESVDYHKQLGSMINTELGSAIIDAHKKHAFSDDVHNAARLAGSTNPKHMEELKGIHERNKDNPHFGTLVSKHPITTHKWNDMDKFNRMIANGNFHNKPNEIDSIVDPAVRQAGGSLPPNQTMESNNLYRKGIRALFESVLDEGNLLKGPWPGKPKSTPAKTKSTPAETELEPEKGVVVNVAKTHEKTGKPIGPRYVPASMLTGRYIKELQRRAEAKREASSEAPRQDSSTQINYRNGIKALFESVLEEMAVKPKSNIYKSPAGRLALSTHLASNGNRKEFDALHGTSEHAQDLINAHHRVYDQRYQHYTKKQGMPHTLADGLANTDAFFHVHDLADKHQLYVKGSKFPRFRAATKENLMDDDGPNDSNGPEEGPNLEGALNSKLRNKY